MVKSLAWSLTNRVRFWRQVLPKWSASLSCRWKSPKVLLPYRKYLRSLNRTAFPCHCQVVFVCLYERSACVSPFLLNGKICSPLIRQNVVQSRGCQSYVFQGTLHYLHLTSYSSFHLRKQALPDLLKVVKSGSDTEGHVDDLLDINKQTSLFNLSNVSQYFWIWNFLFWYPQTVLEPSF